MKNIYQFTRPRSSKRLTKNPSKSQKDEEERGQKIYVTIYLMGQQNVRKERRYDDKRPYWHERSQGKAPRINA